MSYDAYLCRAGWNAKYQNWNYFYVPRYAMAGAWYQRTDLQVAVPREGNPTLVDWCDYELWARMQQ